MDLGLSLLRKSAGKRGWQEGQGLGAQGQGQKEPLLPVQRVGNAGVGFESQPAKKVTKASSKYNQRKSKAPQEEAKPTSVAEAEASHAEFQAIGRMLSAAFNDEADVPKPLQAKRRKGNIQNRSRLTRTNPLID
jgi:hypothetical protein